MDLPGHDRDALVALLDQAMRHEERTQPPAPGEQGGWLSGGSALSEPDENGWVTRVPTEPRWVPRALVFWRMAALANAPVSEELRRDPRHSLARWPELDAAVRRAFGSAEA